MSEYSIRPAAGDDVRALVEMRLAIQQHIGQANPHVLPLQTDSESWLTQSYLAAMKDSHSRIVIAEENLSRAIVGMAVGNIAAQEGLNPPRAGQISDVWVQPAVRRRGLFRSMVADLLEFFLQEGIEAVTLDYIVGAQEAEDLWKKLGFHPVLTIATASLAEVKQRLEDPRQQD